MQYKTCPICHHQTGLRTKECESCGHDFYPRKSFESGIRNSAILGISLFVVYLIFQAWAASQ